MSPIKGVSEARRVPRLGKIQLGIKVEKPGKIYPQATEYFVVPDDIKEIVGDKPKELHIMFPSNDPEKVAPQWLRCYGQTHGLVCWGDGEQGHRKIDKETGDIAGRETKNWEWKDWTCNPQDCFEFAGRCRKVMNLMFLIPEVPGLGVWQIDTSSFYSIREINTTLDMIREFTKRPKNPEGRIAFIPLTLALGPIEVNPTGTSKKTVYIMHLKSNLRLAEVARYALLTPARVVMPDPEVEEAPGDLFPAQILSGEVQPPFEEEATPEAEKDTFPGTQEERLAEWHKVQELMPEVKVDAKAARSYFVQVHDISVALADFEKDTPPERLKLTYLTTFRKRLEQHRMNLA